MRKSGLLYCVFALLAALSVAMAQSEDTQKKATEKKPVPPAGQVKEGGKQVGTGAAEGGKAMGKGSADFGKEIAKGDVKEAGKAMGKGAGEFGKDVGVSTGKGVAQIGKGVAGIGKKTGEAITDTGDSKDKNKDKDKSKSQQKAQKSPEK